MKKNKLLGIVVASIIAMSNVIPAFAEETSSQNSTTNATTIEAKNANKEETLAKLTKKAAKLGVDITGLSNQDAKTKIQAAEATKLGIDITGLSKEEIQAKIKTAMEAKELTKLTEVANKLGVDITGLSNKDARNKIETAEATKLGIDVTGLTNKEIKQKIKESHKGIKSTQITNTAN